MEPLSNLLLVSGGYGITVIASCGIILNILGILILFKEKGRQRIFNYLLSSLLIFDTLFLFFSLAKSVATHFIAIRDEYLNLYASFVSPGLRCTIVCSVLMTVAISHSRFVAVTHPIVHRNSLGSQKDRVKYLLKYIIPILIIAVVLALPSFWEYEVKQYGKSNKL